jgi:hypothetical protein
MRMEELEKQGLTGEGRMVAHWITNGSGGGGAVLRPFVKGSAVFAVVIKRVPMVRRTGTGVQ